MPCLRPLSRLAGAFWSHCGHGQLLLWNKANSNSNVRLKISLKYFIDTHERASCATISCNRTSEIIAACISIRWRLLSFKLAVSAWTGIFKPTNFNDLPVLRFVRDQQPLYHCYYTTKIIIHCEPKKLDPFSFELNFFKYCPILIILSLLQTEINYDSVYHKIYYHTSNMLVHYLVKWTRMYWPTSLAWFRN